MDDIDAIVIPGGGVREAGELPPWVRARFDRALQIWTGEYVMPLSAGTTHRPPPRDEDGFPIPESIAGARYLAAHGIPVGRILPETVSLDTIGNAYFSLVIHVLPRGFERVHVITSAFHMPRAEAIFRWVYGLAPTPLNLGFEAVSDVGIAPEALAARRAREERGLRSVTELTERLTSLSLLHDWLFTEHRAYSPWPERTEVNADTY